MELSFRNQLGKIGEPKPDAAIPPYPSGFHCPPPSLKAALKAMNSPEVSGWQKSGEEKFVGFTWTEECQGVTNDGQFWYFSSNNTNLIFEDKQRIYKFPENMDAGIEDTFSVGKYGCDHLGGIDCYNGRIYAAMEGPSKVVIINSNFQSASEAKLNGSTNNSSPPQGTSFPWCAVNPWNGYLYSSRFNNVTEVYGYDPQDNFKWVTTLQLAIPTNRVQGGCFSKNGHLLLTSDETHDIRCFSVLNGAYLGSAAIQVDASTGEEVEGITIWDVQGFGGVPSQVHVILLDNQVTENDDVFFKHYSVPTPENL